MKSFLGLFVTVLFFAVFATVYSQLTFSPYWGKRSGAQNGPFETQKAICKNANKHLIDIFEFIQEQAQTFIDCNHKE